MKLFQAYLFFLLLSLTTPPAIAQYAKPGCSDTCGNVIISYPFGIGGGCSINPWYTIDCKNSTPYLSAFKLEVLRVDLRNKMVTVNTPRISYCQNSVGNSSHTMSVDLGGSPFLFSKSHNKFVFEGCGVAIMTMDNGSVVTGCSTACVNVTDSDRNNCFGNGCCQTVIPNYLQSYSVNITGLQEEDGACASAFLVENKTSYGSNGRLSISDPFIFRNTSFIPVSLLWTLTDSDQVACCNNQTPPDRFVVVMFNGSIVDTLECASDLWLGGSPYLKDGCRDFGIPKYAKNGCKDTCGNNVTIPYPFGIGADCSVNKWYTVACESSTPYLPALNHLEVLGVNLTNLTVTVGTPRIIDCQSPILSSSQIMGIDLGESPFWFSKSHNKFVFMGCGNAVMMIDNGSVLTACSTTCHGVTRSNRKECFGNGCCQTTISKFLRSYTINVTGLEEEDGDCTGSAFLVDETSYEQGRYSVKRNTSLIPVSLFWTLTESDQVTCFGALPPQRYIVDMLNGNKVATWICDTYSDQQTGNPYLVDGCVESDHDEDPSDEECRRCYDSGGYCTTDNIYDVDGSLFSRNITCIHGKERTSLGVILGISICMSAFLVTTIYTSYKMIKKTITRRRRKSVFKRINGGLLLKQQEEVDPSLLDKTILFTSRELAKATNNYNENRVLGRGGQGTVYKGMLADGRIVAVKKSKLVNENQLEQFINEVVVLSQVNHRNVVRLLGCCLETEVPLLVSEFISNGTLYDRIHDQSHEFPLSLNMRLQIAIDVAQALAYLHSATSIPIYHRDIKTTNILLDDKYRAKVSDFGTSRFVSIDQTHLTTLVKGTIGYLDPEYFQSSQITEKSDVYSFGVVLVELLTGERPISLTRFGENRSLATHFMLAMEEGHVLSIFDAIVIKEGTMDELMIVANLAMRCLNPNGAYRPTMKEVAIELETTRISHIPSTIQANTSPMVYGEDLSILTYGESSTLLSCNDSTSQ